MARIAYQEWKQRKSEQMRHKAKIERMERRRQLMEEQEITMARRQCVLELKRSRGQGGGQIVMSYGNSRSNK